MNPKKAMTNSLFTTKRSLIDQLFVKIRQYSSEKGATTSISNHSVYFSSSTDHHSTQMPLGSSASRPVEELISDQLLSDLFFFLQTPLEHALDLVDKNAITRLINLTCPDHFVFQGIVLMLKKQNLICNSCLT